MDNTSRWPEPQAPPPYQHHHLYGAPPHHHSSLNQVQHHPSPPNLPSYTSSYYPNPNPNPNACPVPSAADAGIIRTPGTAIAEPYLRNPYAPHGGYSYSSAAPASGSSYYYGGGECQGFAVQEAIRQYGVDPFGYGTAPLTPHAMPPPVMPPTWTAKPRSKGGMKGSKKITKTVQSAHCGVCKLDCNSQEVLNSHKQGKKHKKNLQKLQDSIKPKPQKPPVVAVNNVEKEAPVADKPKEAGSKHAKRKAAPATEEDLETKKKKVLEGGAAPDEVRVCTVCNVVVNSQKVYEHHIAGQKHAAMVKQQQETAAS